MVYLSVRLRIIRHQTEVILVSGDSFQHADHPRTVEANKLCLDICIEPKIHDHVFATLQLKEASSRSRKLDVVAVSQCSVATPQLFSASRS